MDLHCVYPRSDDPTYFYDFIDALLEDLGVPHGVPAARGLLRAVQVSGVRCGHHLAAMYHQHCVRHGMMHPASSQADMNALSVQAKGVGYAESSAEELETVQVRHTLPCTS
jgi:hypothetical protein